MVFYERSDSKLLDSMGSSTRLICTIVVVWIGLDGGFFALYANLVCIGRSLWCILGARLHTCTTTTGEFFSIFFVLCCSPSQSVNECGVWVTGRNSIALAHVYFAIVTKIYCSRATGWLEMGKNDEKFL